MRSRSCPSRPSLQDSYNRYCPILTSESSQSHPHRIYAKTGNGSHLLKVLPLHYFSLLLFSLCLNKLCLHHQSCALSSYFCVLVLCFPSIHNLIPLVPNLSFQTLSSLLPIHFFGLVLDWVPSSEHGWKDFSRWKFLNAVSSWGSGHRAFSKLPAWGYSGEQQETNSRDKVTLTVWYTCNHLQEQKCPGADFPCLTPNYSHTNSFLSP